MRSILAILVAVALAGCLGASENNDLGADTTPSSENNDLGADTTPSSENNDLDAPGALPTLDWTWDFTNCRGAIALADVDPDLIQPLLPEGFHTQSTAEGLAGEGTAELDEANVGLETFNCDDHILYGSVFAFVIPPDDLAHDDVDAHFVKWEVLRFGKDADDLKEYGALVTSAGVSSSWSVIGVMASGQISWTVEGNETYQISHAAATTGPESLSFVEFTPAEGGLLEWNANSVIVSGGASAGSLQAPAGTFLGDAIGTDRVDATVLSGTFDFRDTGIRFIERA